MSRDGFDRGDEHADIHVTDVLREFYAYDLEDLTNRLENALMDFPELADETVYLARDRPQEDRKAGAWSWARIIFVPDDKRLTNVTLYHELGHLAIQKRVENGEDHPTTSEEYCSIFAMARMPTVRVDESQVPYLGETEVSKGLHPAICQEALEYRENNRNYIQQCKEWLNGGWEQYRASQRGATADA